MLRNKDNHKGLMKIVYKFIYSFEGLAYFYKYERSAIIHLIASIILCLMAFFLHASKYEWFIIIICLLSILAFELLNTSLEVTVDMITKEYDKNAKAAKDLGSAATFIVSLMTGVISIVIFLPKILDLFK